MLLPSCVFVCVFKREGEGIGSFAKDQKLAPCVFNLKTNVACDFSIRFASARFGSVCESERIQFS